MGRPSLLRTPRYDILPGSTGSIWGPRRFVNSPHERIEIALACHIALCRAATKLRITDQLVRLAGAPTKRKDIDVLIRFPGKHELIGTTDTLCRAFAPGMLGALPAN
jgi:hypothetical protein